MHLIPYVLAYFGLAVFAVAVVSRVAMWARLPMHVRWELYPVAHEAKKAHYGGSYLEESEWWKKPRESSLLGELKAMIPEIVFLVAVKEHNPSLWLRTFPFHFGLYMVIGCTALLMGAAVAGLVVPGLLAGPLGTLVAAAVVVLGAGGLVLGLIGALGLLHRRLTHPDLKDYTAPADIFNLLFFIAAFGCSLLSFVLVDNNFGRVATFIGNLVAFDPAPLSGSGLETALPAASVILMSLLVAYIPLTHMSHFIAKYFAYHAIRWNDAPNLQGGPEEKTIGDLLTKPVTWSADHINADGKKTWADVATEMPKDKEKK
jgi:nitrate reductase gamma subunit